MILYSPRLAQLESFFDYFPISLHIADNCCSCWLTAFCVPRTLKLLQIFFSADFFLHNSLAVNPKNKQTYMASLLISPIDSSLTVAIPLLFLAVCCQTWMFGTSLVLTQLCSLCPTTLGTPTKVIVSISSTH